MQPDTSPLLRSELRLPQPKVRVSLPPELGYVVWDWNGTLLDDAWLCLDVMNGLLTARGLPPISAEWYSEVFRFPVCDYYASLGFDFAKESFERIGTEFIEEYQARQHLCCLRVHAQEALTAVADAGMIQSLLSASQEWRLEEQVARLGVRGRFSAVLGLRHHFATSKLARGEEWLAAHDIAPSRVVLVGDTDHDAEVARRLGMHCVLVPSGHQAASRLAECGVPVLSSLKEVAVSFECFRQSPCVEA